MSKKLLLGSTALVGAFALATPAYADIEVTLSGETEFGARIGDDDTVDSEADANPAERGYTFFMDSEVKLEAEGAADNGVNYSGKVELEADADVQDINADETVIALWGGFGRVELGREDGAADTMFVGGEDFQAGTGGVDGDQPNLNFSDTTLGDSSDAAKITYYTPRVAGFQLGASFTPDTGDDENANDDDADVEDHWELGANFTTSAGGADVTVAGVASIGDGEDNAEDLEDYAVGLGLEFAGFGIGGSFITRQEVNEGEGYIVGAKYGFGPANVSVGFSYDDPDEGDDSKVYTADADYGLFPGVTLNGGIAYNDEDEDAGGDSTTAGVVTMKLNY